MLLITINRQTFNLFHFPSLAIKINRMAEAKLSLGMGALGLISQKFFSSGTVITNYTEDQILRGLYLF